MITHNITVPVATSQRLAVNLTLPWFIQKTEFTPVPAVYEPLINGEDTFRAVHQAIDSAKASIDIVCWGFQPSMYFIRDGCHPCIGELLMLKAAQGVKVRVLAWEMPFNSAGVAGEANLPGKGPIRIKDRVLQNSTRAQYDYDRDWFNHYAVADEQAARRVADNVPVLVSRGFSVLERAEIDHWVKYRSMDPNVSWRARKAMSASATHHQKSILVDYELPNAVGFVMGHNMLDEYWDTDSHSALNRTQATAPNPDRGPRGALPRQDISCKISGPVLEHLHCNFAWAWRRETGEDLFQSRQSIEAASRLTCDRGTRIMTQLLRTQAQEHVYDIEKLYLNAANNVCQFIYIENQYFRWGPLAEKIKQIAERQTSWGRDPAQHNAIHLFVITNDTNDGIGMGTLKTQEMLAQLGRADVIPGVTRLLRIKQIRADAPPKPQPETANDHAGQRKLDEWQAEQGRKTREAENSTVQAQEVPGLKVHVCSLVAPDSPEGQPWMPVYIHSKLMIVDDVFTTHGSANLNTRSMMVDSELNICHEHPAFSRPLRQRLWGMYTNRMGAQDEPELAFKAWGEMIRQNKEFKSKKLSPVASLVEFYYGETTVADFD
ncbi:phospholipase D-like domain-containing protein [Pseudomonas ficuserectae]|uniref:phospholipase D-like domain-containing protein n=1 Tax=Pseudomonas ficuserectae TaxID=53410 RepID=UPI00211CEDA4|nr:phospholipase D-like domain-containing protein [Pseudomonas ficuserectae]